MKVIANADRVDLGAGDGIHADTRRRRLVSRPAISGALALEDLSSGERLTALAIASYADRDHRAWPGTPAAAARAGLGRSRYLQARERLEKRGLIQMETRATGRGRSSTVALLFAETGPWWEGEMNAELLESVLSFSRARGPARLLLAAMAAVADDSGTVRGVSSEELCSAAGLTDRTYRRARRALIASGELVLEQGRGGRGVTNVWHVLDPRELAQAARPARPARRVPPPATARPLLAEARPAPLEATNNPSSASVDADGSHEKGGTDRTVPIEKCPILTGVSKQKGGTEWTLFAPPKPKTPAETPAKTPAQTPAKTPAKTPAPNARAGSESLNPRTREDPPNPPTGGNVEQTLIEQEHRTTRGRTRRRLVPVDLEEVRRDLGLPGAGDREAWERVRAQLRDQLGEAMFAAWIEPLELVAVDPSGELVLAGPAALVSWVRQRYRRPLAQCAEREARVLRFAKEPERLALGITAGALL